MNNETVDSLVMSEAMDTDHVVKLVPLGHNNNVTSSVWNFISARATSRNAPHNWPLSNDDAARYPYYKTPLLRTVALVTGIVDKYRGVATEMYERDGTVWYAALDHGNSDILGVRPGCRGITALWLMPNEQGGVTLMFADDYHAV